MEFSAGFHTLDQAAQLRPFGRGSFWIAETHRGAAVAGLDWTASLYTQSNVVTGTTVYESPDNWDGGGEGVDNVTRMPNTFAYHDTLFLFLDTSSGTNTVKLGVVGDAGDLLDDFDSIQTGVQGYDDNNYLVAHSSTGITFSGGDMVDGDHVVQWKWKHDTAKIDTYYTETVVLNVASNVITAYRAIVTHTADYPTYKTVSEAKVSGYKQWQATWDPDANTWTVNTTDKRWASGTHSNVHINTSGGTLTKEMDNSTIKINTSDPYKGLMWEVTVG